jgi:ABC-2 type transport system ATP-binding protein
MISMVQALEPQAVQPQDATLALVTVSRLTKSFGSRTAVSDVSFEARPGVTGILGPNGAGKSTLLRCLAGLSGWDSGEIRIGGVDPARRVADARRRIGFMPERVAFPLEMRVWRYLRYVAEMKGIDRRERADSVDIVLARAGLSAARSRIIGNLSKGYRQRVGLAQALLGEPSVLILDEPSAGLDPLNVMEFRDVIRHCARDRAVLVSTHMLSEARLLCDSVVVMSGGAVVYDGATTDFAGADSTLDAVEDAFRRAVLGDLPPAPRAAPGAGR